MIEVIPGINEADFEKLKHLIGSVIDLVPWIHIDVLDNTLIKNVTYNNFDSFKVFNGRVKFEAHLMVSDPVSYIQPLVANGFDRLYTHVEAHDVRDFLHAGKLHPLEVGVALDSVSELDLVEPFLDEVNAVLVLATNAGQLGQVFQREQLPKIRKIHESYPELPITVEGGIDTKTAPLVVDNGATRLVVNSYLFGKNQAERELNPPDKDRLAGAIEELKNSGYSS